MENGFNFFVEMYACNEALAFIIDGLQKDFLTWIDVQSQDCETTTSMSRKTYLIGLLFTPIFFDMALCISGIGVYNVFC